MINYWITFISEVFMSFMGSSCWGLWLYDWDPWFVFCLAHCLSCSTLHVQAQPSLDLSLTSIADPRIWACPNHFFLEVLERHLHLDSPGAPWAEQAQDWICFPLPIPSLCFLCNPLSELLTQIPTQLSNEGYNLDKSTTPHLSHLH